MARTERRTGTLAICEQESCRQMAKGHGLAKSTAAISDGLCVACGHGGVLSAFTFDTEKDRLRCNGAAAKRGTVVPRRVDARWEAR